MSLPRLPDFQIVLADSPGADAWAEWSVLRSTSTWSSPFSVPAFLLGVSKGTGRSLQLAIVRADGKPLLGIPLYADRRIGIRRAGMPPLVPYAPLLQSGNWSGWATHQKTDPLTLLARTLHARYGAVALHLPPEWVDVRPFIWQGWTASPLFTYRAALDDPAGPLARWAKNNRRDFRFYAADYVVREDIGERERVVELIAMSYARHGRSLPISPDRLSGLLDSLLPSDFARLFLATDRMDRPMAGLVLLVDGDRVFYWLSGSRPGPAMTVLIGTLFQWLAAEGKRSIDFVGANTPSIAEFKRRFGSELVPYFRLVRFSGALTRGLHTIRPLV